MKRHENQHDEELQHNIEEQEQAMSELLLRVMERPLTPLHRTIEELQNQVAKVQEASVKAALSVEAGLSEVLDGQSKRMNRHASDVADGIESLKEDLAGLASALEKDRTAKAERDAHTQDSLARAGAMLGQLDAKADAAGLALTATARDLKQLDETLVGVREQQQTAADCLSQELDGLGGRMEDRHTRLDGSIGQATSLLAQLDVKSGSTNDSLAAAAAAVAKIDTELAALRAQEQAAAGDVNRELSGLAQRLQRQQTELYERIEAVQQAMAPQFNTLAATIDQSSKEIARQYESLPEAQKVLVAATVQEQLALQLAPFQTQVKWLVAVCGLSFASTLALLGFQLLH